MIFMALLVHNGISDAYVQYTAKSMRTPDHRTQMCLLNIPFLNHGD